MTTPADGRSLLYLRYLRVLLAGQDDPRAAILLEQLPEHVEHRNPDWTLHAYLLDRLSAMDAFAAPVADRAGHERGLAYPIEHWLAWRYHGGRDCGKPEPSFPTPEDKAALLRAIETEIAALNAPDGLRQATRWYVDRMRARLEHFERRGPTPRPLEHPDHSRLRHEAFLAEKREQLAKLEANPTFPGYERKRRSQTSVSGRQVQPQRHTAGEGPAQRLRA